MCVPYHKQEHQVDSDLVYIIQYNICVGLFIIEYVLNSKLTECYINVTMTIGEEYIFFV